MNVKLKKEYGAWSQGELTYVQGETYDVDKRYAEDVLLPSGCFEEKREAKKQEKLEDGDSA